MEGFYTGMILPATKSNAWFSDPPPLPDREFNLYAIGILFTSPFVSISTDWAFSEAFAVGRDFYGNLGILITPAIPYIPALSVYSSKRIPQPLSISLTADVAGSDFIGRDGVNHGSGFRVAGKTEWKGSYSSLLRINTTLRAAVLGESFNRSSTGFYWRFPSSGSKTLRFTRISFSVDRNAVNIQKINDGYKGILGLSLDLPWQIDKKNSPYGINFTALIKNSSSSEKLPTPYPIPMDTTFFDSAGIDCELSWSPDFLQFKTKCGYTTYAKKDGQWDASFSVAIRFKKGRLSFKASSPDFPDEWNYTISWRL